MFNGHCDLIAAILIAGAAGPAPSAPGADPPLPQTSRSSSASPSPGGEASSQPFAPAARIEEAFLHLQVAVGVLGEKVAFNAGMDAAAAAELSRQINELQDLFGDAGSAPDADYVQSLDFAATAILAAANEAEPGAANRALAPLLRDFRIKIASARASLGATGRPPDSILVTVTTRRGNRAAPGYLIRAATALHAGSPPIYNFSNPTAPATSRRLVPGIYLLHAYRNGREVRVANPEHDIGLDGEDSANLVLVVP